MHRTASLFESFPVSNKTLVICTSTSEKLICILKSKSEEADQEYHNFVGELFPGSSTGDNAHASIEMGADMEPLNPWAEEANVKSVKKYSLTKTDDDILIDLVNEQKEEAIFSQLNWKAASNANALEENFGPRQCERHWHACLNHVWSDSD